METAAAYLSELCRRLSARALLSALKPAVRAIFASARDGTLTYVFGTGHTHLLALELHCRAEGPAVVPALDEALMLHKGAIDSMGRERKPRLAAEVLGR
jgi:uncharacterized phosphosugar-binding protein